MQCCSRAFITLHYIAPYVDDLEAIRGKLHEILQKIGKTKENDERREIVRGYLPKV